MHDRQSHRQRLRQWLNMRDPEPVTDFDVLATEVTSGLERKSIRYAARDGDEVTAFLLLPREVKEPTAAVVIHHQHNGERHFGKSEVCGLVGDPLQAFGPALAERGVVVIAPDSMCFEDRRTNCKGTVPYPDDWQQHYNEMAYRLLRGDTLMRKVLEDAESAISVLTGLEPVDPSRVGVLGHSYGGNTALFQGALDVRAQYTASSGAVCSFREKMLRGTGIEMAEVLPNGLSLFEMENLLRLIAPRQLLVVSAAEDPYSRDAHDIVHAARSEFTDAGSADALQHFHYEGGHALTAERFSDMVAWVVKAGAKGNERQGRGTLCRPTSP